MLWNMNLKKIISPNVYQDIVTLERDGSRIDHADGAHDDSLMSYLFFRYALHHGTGLRDRFGINAIPSETNMKK